MRDHFWTDALVADGALTADPQYGAYLGEARHPPSVVLPLAGGLFALLALLGLVGLARGAIAGGATLLVLFGAAASVVLGHSTSRLHVFERGMELRGLLGKTRMGFDEVARTKVLMGGRGVRRPLATDFYTADSRRISVSTSWQMSGDVERALDAAARRVAASA